MKYILEYDGCDFINILWTDMTMDLLLFRVSTSSIEQLEEFLCLGLNIAALCYRQCGDFVLFFLNVPVNSYEHAGTVASDFCGSSTRH